MEKPHGYYLTGNGKGKYQPKEGNESVDHHQPIAKNPHGQPSSQVQSASKAKGGCLDLDTSGKGYDNGKTNRQDNTKSGINPGQRGFCLGKGFTDHSSSPTIRQQVYPSSIRNAALS
jgi:hypothetical protein